MPYTTNVAGTTITASWGNANVRDQVITPFASASARDSAIGSPIEGMYADLADVNVLTRYDGAKWRYYQSVLYWAQRTTTSTSTTTEQGVLRLDSMDLMAGRSYRIWTSPLNLLSSVTNDIVSAIFRANTAGTATTSSTQIASVAQKTDSSHPPAVCMDILYQTSSAVTVSLLLSVARLAGTGNASIFGSLTEIYVADLGPSLTDTGVDI